MSMLATLSSLNLFSSLPTNPPPAENPFSAPSPFKPPIPIPKYPKPLHKSNKKNLHQNSVSTANSSSKSDAFKTPHRNTKYFRPVKEGQVISSEGSDRAVVIGDSGLSYLLPGAPFEFKYSYSETPKAKPLAIREPAFLPFAPPTMNRPWTGKAPLKKSKQNIPLFQSLNEIQLDEAEEGNGEKDSLELRMEMLKPFSLGRNMEKSRKGVLGEPLRKAEIKMMIQPYLSTNRQVNLGRDGLTHNMLELIHSHWRREKVCKVRCKGIPTVDMDNVCYHLEKKTGGKIIHRVGGVVYLFRGRNYDYRTRPQYPVMLWKPAAPVYPKLIQAAPEGLTKVEADELRKKGKNLLPICKLAKNGVYISLVKDVRNAFEGSQLVKIDCEGMHASDYKKLGAKLKELVPCVLLSFDDEQILMWRGHEWKSMYRETLSPIIPTKNEVADHLNKPDDYDGECLKRDPYAVNSSPKMTSLWKGAVESSKALLLDEINLGPDALLKKVNEFEGLSQAALHSYPATVSSGEDSSSSFDTEYENSLQSGESDEEVSYSDDEDEDYDDEDPYDIETDGYSSVPIGSLRVDHIAERLAWERKTEQ